MALNKPDLIEDIKAIMNLDNEGKKNEDEAIKRLANAIENYVKSGTVTGACPSNGGALINGKVE